MPPKMPRPYIPVARVNDLEDSKPACSRKYGAYPVKVAPHRAWQDQVIQHTSVLRRLQPLKRSRKLAPPYPSCFSVESTCCIMAIVSSMSMCLLLVSLCSECRASDSLSCRINHPSGSK